MIPLSSAGAARRLWQGVRARVKTRNVLRRARHVVAREKHQSSRRLRRDGVFELVVCVEQELLLVHDLATRGRRQAIRPSLEEYVIVAVGPEARVAAVRLLRKTRHEDDDVRVHQVGTDGAPNENKRIIQSEII